MLVWIHCPSLAYCKLSKCDPGNCFCSCKNKFGLNLQAVCDAKRRFLDLSIAFPGTTSDCLAFEQGELYSKLEDGLMVDGLTLFGNNAYLNSIFMATPFPNVSGGSKDHYNFYFSQIRITIECAFGMLCHRWSILRGPIPMNVSIAKTCALVLALAKMHNFCIDANDVAAEPTRNDAVTMELNGAVPLQDIVMGNNSGRVPSQLLGGGHHMDGLASTVRRQTNYRNRNQPSQLPRSIMHNQVMEMNILRPVPFRRLRQI
jgi:hypothetical protein